MENSQAKSRNTMPLAKSYLKATTPVACEKAKDTSTLTKDHPLKVGKTHMSSTHSREQAENRTVNILLFIFSISLGLHLCPQATGPKDALKERPSTITLMDHILQAPGKAGSFCRQLGLM